MPVVTVGLVGSARKELVVAEQLPHNYGIEQKYPWQPVTSPKKPVLEIKDDETHTLAVFNYLTNKLENRATTVRVGISGLFLDNVLFQYTPDNRHLEKNGLAITVR